MAQARKGRPDREIDEDVRTQFGQPCNIACCRAFTGSAVGWRQIMTFAKLGFYSM
jgi:hypothetical protein